MVYLFTAAFVVATASLWFCVNDLFTWKPNLYIKLLLGAAWVLTYIGILALSHNVH